MASLVTALVLSIVIEKFVHQIIQVVETLLISEVKYKNYRIDIVEMSLFDIAKH